jgi:hypothetical protein
MSSVLGGISKDYGMEWGEWLLSKLATSQIICVTPSSARERWYACQNGRRCACGLMDKLPAF